MQKQTERQQEKGEKDNLRALAEFHAQDRRNVERKEIIQRGQRELAGICRNRLIPRHVERDSLQFAIVDMKSSHLPPLFRAGDAAEEPHYDSKNAGEPVHRHSCHHFTHCCLVDSHAVSYDLIKCSTCVKAQGNEDLFLYSQIMTPQGSALQLWPDQISNVVDVIESKSKTIVKFFCCVLLERFGALGVDPLAVTSPSSMEDVNNPCHDCVLTVLSTHALLQSVRNKYDSIVGSFNREGGATKVKSGIWMEVTDNVNAKDLDTR
ncbi:hypothetical protein F7725_013504 [Dissostichus mawsoni]|uniref:Uncharacterized protein n=1 Tax=Dissostichus mawsoni TaxID=36200 RepID=A0A7J5Y4W9_DISMA|nr:hypothetical protein F7725_013504 [Dissostichus mawsoni]